MANGSMTEKEGQQYAVEHGTHALLNKVVKFAPCGCKPDGAGNLPSPVRVVFCKQHKVAIETLREVYQQHECNPAENFCRICRIIEDAGFKFP